MPDYSTFGVVLGDLNKYGHRIEADTDTSPTLAQVGELIAARAAQWHNFMLSVGVQPATISGDTELATYAISKEWIARAAAHDVLQARTRNPSELTLALADQTRQTLRDIEERVSRLGAGAAVGVGAANRLHTNIERAAEIASVRERQSLGARLAYSGGL